ncbi:MAG: hypothetical protein J7L11_11035 [Thermoprotei archaeon]|nr:hypothetical protein [Thermoprotei archaeon]
MVLFVIEHLEPVLSKWAWLEYKHASEIVGRERLLITNVKDPREARILKRIAIVSSMSITEVGSPPERVLVLDPQAFKRLDTCDMKDVDFVVIGGIMGDHPPRGRTRVLLTSRLPGCKARNLGEGQFSVDGAIYIAFMVSKGASLSQIPVVNGLEIRVNEYFTIELPYMFPVINGRPLISDELVNYLIYEIEDHEVEAIRSGDVKSIADYEAP